MRILVEQLHGETFELEVTAEMTMRAVKEQLKRIHTWEDELSRDTTVVEVIAGDKKIKNEETLKEMGLCHGSKVTVVFRKNVVLCSNKSGFGCDLDPEALVIVEIPVSATGIEVDAFKDCKRIAKVIIPSSVTDIWEGAFRGCTSLVNVTIPDSITYIGAQAFASCCSMPSVNIPESVTQIANCTFWGCTSLVVLTIPDSITHIGARAFAGCTSLRSVSVPDSVTHISTYAFQDCSSLVSVNIPDSVTWIGLHAFSHCNQLTLTAPARVLGLEVGVGCKLVAKECGCGRCDWEWFRKAWVCPVHHCDSQQKGVLTDASPLFHQ